jgi:hypothetical protein
MPSYPNPLSAEDCAALTAIGQSCHGTSELIQACKDCGMPVEEQENANNAQIEYAKSLKAKFFPNNP